jgi:hypothetical protein
VNDEKKETNLHAAHPSASGLDDDAWDDDEGGGTLVTEGPTFDIPAHVPSPITVPPPPSSAAIPMTAATPKPEAVAMADDVLGPMHPPQATLVGLMPEDLVALLPRAPSSSRALTPERPRDDATMAGAPSPTSARPLRDDAPSSRPRADAERSRPRLPVSSPRLPTSSSRLPFSPPTSPMFDSDPAMAGMGTEPWLPIGHEIEDTRPVQRDEMARPRDAQVVVADDAEGEDATLAIRPGQIAGLFPSGRSVGPSLAEDAKPRGAASALPEQRAKPMLFVQGVKLEPPSSDRLLNATKLMTFDPNDLPASARGPGFPSGNQAQGFQGETPHHGNLPYGGAPVSFGPPSHAPSPQSLAPSLQSNAPGWGAPAGAPYPPSPQWNAPAPFPVAPPTPPGGATFNPQALLLIGVGVVCLAIFVIGVWLFATTKF